MRTLVLNAGDEPLAVNSVMRALVLVLKEKAGRPAVNLLTRCRPSRPSVVRPAGSARQQVLGASQGGAR